MTGTCDENRPPADTGPCGCDSAPAPLSLRPQTVGRIDVYWTDGVVKTPIGDVPRARTVLGICDHWGTLRARWGVGRMDYRVAPGLYAAGQPTLDSPVLVSANYKLSFDHLRRALAGRDGWILVLDTNGINVWCAAGKGTFSTAEIVRRVRRCGLDRVVSHRKLIVPQLGAPGVAAHEVRAATGFRVIYGPVRAADLPAFLDARMKAAPGMRRVRFSLRDRAVLIPVEIVMGGKYALATAAAFLLIGGLGSSGYSLASLRTTGASGALLVLTGFLTASVFGPMLLPWLPGRAFSVKGAALGALLVSLAMAFGLHGPGLPGSWLHVAAWAVMVPTITSFVVMNFTGSSTFTSLSGVLREMRFAVPAQVAGAVIGLSLWVAGLFVSGGVPR